MKWNGNIEMQNGRIIGLVESFSGHIEEGEVKTYVVDQAASFNYTIEQLIIQCGSGSCNVSLRVGGANITGITSIAVGTSQVTATATGGNSVVAGNRINLVVNSNSSAEDISFTIRVRRS